MNLLSNSSASPRIGQIGSHSDLLDDSYNSEDYPSETDERGDGLLRSSEGPKSEKQNSASMDVSVNTLLQDGGGAGGAGDTSLGMSNNSSYMYAEGEIPVVLITTVDIGDGKMGRVQVREGEDTQEVARRFCEEYNLPPEVLLPLSKHLSQNIEALSGKANKRDGSARNKGPHSSQPLQMRDGKAHSKNGRLYHSTGEQQVHVYVEGGRSHNRSLHRDQNLPPVHERLYAYAEVNERRKQQRAAELQAELDAEVAAQRESISWVSRELASSRNVGEYLNYGERLYVEGVVEMERKKQLAEARRQEEELAELQGHTFHPQISHMASEIHRPIHLSTWERLSRGYSNQKEMLEARKRIQQEENAAKEVQECTFRPVINRRSQQMMTGRTAVLREHQITAHEQLFQDAIRRQLRQDEYEEWYPEDVTFHPQTNPPDSWKRAYAAAAQRASASGSLRGSREGQGPADTACGVEVTASPDGSMELPANFYGGSKSSQTTSRNVKRNSAPARTTRATMASQSSVGMSSVRGSYCSSIPKETPAFAERLYSYKDEHEKRRAARAAAEAPDFKPKTGRGPAPGYGRKLRGQSVGEYLYNKHYEYESKKEFLSDQIIREEEGKRRASKMTGMSEQLMENLKKRRFSQIFSFLDAGNEGALDLVGIALSDPDRLQHLDTEVRFDVVEAARLLQARRDAFARRCEANQSMSADEIPEVLLVDADGFSALMDEVLNNSKGLIRPYLQPAPASSRLDYPEFDHHPHINPKSKELASKRRPGNIPAHQAMMKEWERSKVKMEIQKAAKEEAELAGCTFEPQLISEQLVSHGRALRMSQALHAVNSSTEWEEMEGLPLKPEQHHRYSQSKKGRRQRQPDQGHEVDSKAHQIRASREKAADGQDTGNGSAKSTPAKSLLELAGMSMNPDLGGETEQVLKHLGERDAAEFRYMQQELQQILLQSPTAGAQNGASGNHGEAPLLGQGSAVAVDAAAISSPPLFSAILPGHSSGGARKAGADVWFPPGHETKQWLLDDVLGTDSEDDNAEIHAEPVPGGNSQGSHSLRKDDGTPLSAADLIDALAGSRQTAPDIKGTY